MGSHIEEITQTDCPASVSMPLCCHVPLFSHASLSVAQFTKVSDSSQIQAGSRSCISEPLWGTWESVTCVDWILWFSNMLWHLLPKGTLSLSLGPTHRSESHLWVSCPKTQSLFRTGHWSWMNVSWFLPHVTLVCLLSGSLIWSCGSAHWCP